MDRKRTPAEIETAVLTKSARRCALCFGLNHDLREKKGQIAHIDQNPANFAEDNLAFLCLEHHSDYDSRTKQHKNYTASEVRAFRESLWTAIANGKHAVAGTQVKSAQERDSEAKFDRQVTHVGDPAVLTKIRQKPHWRILIRSTEFMDAQFKDLNQCHNFVLAKQVEARQRTFPMVGSPPRIRENQQSRAVCGETDFVIGSETFLECWTMFQSGQFVLNRALPDHPNLNNSVHVLQILRVVSQAFEFARRMAKEGVLSGDAIIMIDLREVDGIELFMLNEQTGLHAKMKKIELDRRLSLSELEANGQEHALDAAIELYSRFGWKDVDREALKAQQPAFFQL